jgi:integrase
MNRPKNFLTEAEIADFLKAARKGRHRIRNYAMLLLAFRHGLRVSELIDMRMPDVHLNTGRLFVRRGSQFAQTESRTYTPACERPSPVPRLHPGGLMFIGHSSSRLLARVRA